MADDQQAKPLLKSTWKIIPKFPCANVARTVDFYTKALHFELGGAHPSSDMETPAVSSSGEEKSSSTQASNDQEEDLVMCSVFTGHKAAANIYLFRTPEGFTPSAAMIALGTSELDQYYECLVREGVVTITEAIKDKPWGYRQFEVVDLDGNKLQFFKFLEGGNPGDD